MGQWQKVFYIAAGVYFFGGVVFLAFGSSVRQPWTYDDDEEDLVIGINHVQGIEGAGNKTDSRDDDDDEDLVMGINHVQGAEGAEGAGNTTNAENEDSNLKENLQERGGS